MDSVPIEWHRRGESAFKQWIELLAMSGVFFFFFFNVKDSLPGKSPIQNESECKNKSELERGKIR